MSEENIKKVIVLVEDELNDVEGMLLSVQTILSVAAKRKMKNIPGNLDTKIYLLCLQEENKVQDERIEQIFRNMQTWQEKVGVEPKMVFDYAKFFYESGKKDCESDYLAIKEKVDEWVNEKAYSILLDVVLNKDSDTESVLKGEEILSQKIYKNYKTHCIPYTKYSDYDEQFRNEWKKGAECNQLPYERFRILGGYVYKPVQDQLYGHLGITE